jgi:hypothetical protein
MIYGMPGSGKTLIAIDLMISYIKGDSFACFKCDRNDDFYPRALYATDEGISGIPERFRVAINHHDINPYQMDNHQFRATFTLPNLYQVKHQFNVDTFLSDVAAEYGLNGPNLVIIDTLKNATIGSKENSNDDAAVIAMAAKRIKTELECIVIFIHHSDKQGRWMRGASAFLGDMDTVIKVEVGKMSVEKVKDGEKSIPQSFTLLKLGQSSVIEWSGDFKETSTADKCFEYLMKNSSKKFSAKEVALATDLNQSNVIRELKNLTDNYIDIASELTYPTKKASSRNPAVYWYESPGIL